MIATFVLIVVTVAIIVGTRKYDKRLRSRFNETFAVDVPSKNTCPEEKEAIRDIARRHIANCLAAAKGYAATKSSSKDINTIRMNYQSEQDYRRDAIDGFRLAKYFGLVPKGIKSPEDFTSKV